MFLNISYLEISQKPSHGITVCYFRSWCPEKVSLLITQNGGAHGYTYMMDISHYLANPTWVNNSFQVNPEPNHRFRSAQCRKVKKIGKLPRQVLLGSERFYVSYCRQSVYSPIFKMPMIDKSLHKNSSYPNHLVQNSPPGQESIISSHGISIGLYKVYNLAMAGDEST